MNAAKRPQTIQIFLPTGDPKGIRPAEITTRSVRVFDAPRRELKLFSETPESTRPRNDRHPHQSLQATTAMKRGFSL